MVMMWASAAARTEEILFEGKKGRKRTFGVADASSCRRERWAPSPTKTSPAPSD